MAWLPPMSPSDRLLVGRFWFLLSRQLLTTGAGSSIPYVERWLCNVLVLELTGGSSDLLSQPLEHQKLLCFPCSPQNFYWSRCAFRHLFSSSSLSSLELGTSLSFKFVLQIKSQLHETKQPGAFSPTDRTATAFSDPVSST
jgi:hypothetical protein